MIATSRRSRAGKAYFTGPTYVGIIAVVLPFFVHFNINGLDYIAAGGAAVGLLAGGAGVVVGLKAPKEERGTKLGAAGVVLLLSLFTLFRSGFFG